MNVIFLIAVLALSVGVALALARGLLGSVFYLMTYQQSLLHVAAPRVVPETAVLSEDQAETAFLAPAA